MRVVLDTNVFVSGVFFSGPPYQILSAWRDGLLQVVVSAEIVAEYVRVGDELAREFPRVDLEPALGLVAAAAELIEAVPLPEPICDDPADGKFLARAVAGHCRFVISGDKHLLRATGYRGISVVRPRAFVETYLSAG